MADARIPGRHRDADDLRPAPALPNRRNQHRDDHVVAEVASVKMSPNTDDLGCRGISAGSPICTRVHDGSLRAAPAASEDVLEGHRTQLSTDSAEARSDPPRSPPVGSELTWAHARRSRVRGPAQLRSGPRTAASMYDKYTSALSEGES